MNNINALYNRWLAQPDLDDAVKAELVSIAGDSDAVTKSCSSSICSSDVSEGSRD